MDNYELLQKFGFCEMYEWANVPEERLGLFVTFDREKPNKIVPFGETKDGKVLGVTSINSVIDSDNPGVWKYAYLCNEYGDPYLKKEKLAVGQKVYDQVLEFNYIQTRPWEHYIPIENKFFNKELKYIPRTSRVEWSRVTLMGKAIVKDNGNCVPGQYCSPYTGKLKKNFGMAVPTSESTAEEKYYVLDRISKNTILILVK